MSVTASITYVACRAFPDKPLPPPPSHYYFYHIVVSSTNNPPSFYSLLLLAKIKNTSINWTIFVNYKYNRVDRDARRVCWAACHPLGSRRAAGQPACGWGRRGRGAGAARRARVRPPPPALRSRWTPQPPPVRPARGPAPAAARGPRGARRERAHPPPAAGKGKGSTWAIKAHISPTTIHPSNNGELINIPSTAKCQTFLCHCLAAPPDSWKPGYPVTDRAVFLEFAHVRGGGSGER